MRVRVLGAAAGGGFPQWNCACENCALVRAGDARVEAATQDSIAVSGRAGRWLVVNASPDVHRHIQAFAELHPTGPRHTPIAAIALTNGDMDHVAGLLSLRESQPLTLLATEPVRAGLVERNALLRTLARFPEQVRWTKLDLASEVVLDDVGLGVRAVAASGKLPVHLTGLVEPSAEDNVALRIRDLATGRTVVLATAIGSLDGVDAMVAGADALFFDGTFWSQDELVARGLGKAYARDMAHVPVGGHDGSLERLAKVVPAMRVYTHVNNTNPMLRKDSPERAAVEHAGWRVAHDGFEVTV